MLSESSLQTLQTGILIDELAPTLKDAVLATQRLGFRYLWIDALCIMQDSTDDKNKELVRMQDYYRYAALCLQPTGLSSVQEQFLNKTTAPKRKISDASYYFDSEFSRSVTFLSSEGLQDEVFLEVKPKLYQEEFEPLHKRGWVLQERLLCPRVLIFPGAGGLVWQCEEWETFDGKVYSYPGSPMRYRLGTSDVSQLADYGLSGWQRVIEDFASRKLTDAGDKLVAIAALAHEFNERYGGQLGEYYAGYWQKHLSTPLSLMWMVEPWRRTTAMTVKRAPSWSWAAVDGMSIQMDFSTPSGSNIDCEILHCIVDLKDANQLFGAVEGGSLRLKCKLGKAVWQRNEEPKETYGYDEYCI
jgi:hypothetical protein